jgi:hypothetical protein
MPERPPERKAKISVEPFYIDADTMRTSGRSCAVGVGRMKERKYSWGQEAESFRPSFRPRHLGPVDSRRVC